MPNKKATLPNPPTGGFGFLFVTGILSLILVRKDGVEKRSKTH
jgi:hypothetical protein